MEILTCLIIVLVVSAIEGIYKFILWLFKFIKEGSEPLDSDPVKKDLLTNRFRNKL